MAILKKAQDYKAKNNQVVRSTISNANDQNKLFRQVSKVQTELKHDGLSAATIKAQQELSEKYGIPTFDVKGNISTVPSSGIINTDINVGTGNLSDSDYKKSIDVIVRNQSIPASSGGSGLFDGIAKGVTEFFDDIFKFDTIESIPEEIAAQIDEIDRQIAELKRRLGELPQQPNRSNFATDQEYNRKVAELASFRNEAVSINNQIESLMKRRTEIMLNYKTKTDIMDKIRLLIDDLTALSQVETLTAELRVTIQEKIAEASKTVERILVENLNVTQATINELNRAVLLANERYKAQATISINDANDNIDGTAELIQLFPELFKDKSDNEKAEQLVKDYQIQKLAIQMALARGVFNK